MLEIETPKKIRSVRELWARAVKHDPRRFDFGFDQVTVDLRKSSTIHGPAAMWCLIYLLLARQVNGACELRMPQDDTASSSLNSTGLIGARQSANVIVSNTGSNRDTTHSVLPVTAFSTIYQAEDTTNIALERLVATGKTSVNLYTKVSEMFAEFANNTAEHSESPVGGFGWVMYQESGPERRLICAVADGSIGIRKSLSRNPDHLQKTLRDWSAIHDATKERVSGTGNPYRGVGLSAIEADMTQIGREAVIHSATGILRVRPNLERHVSQTRFFPRNAGRWFRPDLKGDRYDKAEHPQTASPPWSDLQRVCQGNLSRSASCCE